jgi:hypothetical protein
MSFTMLALLHVYCTERARCEPRGLNRAGFSRYRALLYFGGSFEGVGLAAGNGDRAP